MRSNQETVGDQNRDYCCNNSAVVSYVFQKSSKEQSLSFPQGLAALKTGLPHYNTIDKGCLGETYVLT